MPGGVPLDEAGTKTCPMCAEDIPYGAKACEYCGARFEVTRSGYCPHCHSVGPATPEGACEACGAEAIDARIESRSADEAPAAQTPVTAPQPAAAVAPPPAPPPPPPPPAVPQPGAYTSPPPPAPPRYAPPPPYAQPYAQTPAYAQPQPYGAPAPAAWTYQSGMGGLSVVPPEIRGWNWGAFFLSWIWGIGNNTWLALLTFIPYVGFVMPFVLGAKGNEWAWRNKHWESVERFRSAQRAWAIAGLIIFAIAVVMTVIAVIVSESQAGGTTTTGMTI